MRPSIRARALRLYLRTLVRPRCRHVTDVGPEMVTATRRRLARLATRVTLPRGLRIEPARVAGIPGEWLSPPGTIRGHGLYLHGGAYAVGSPRLYRGIAGRLALATGSRVLVPDYRLAPEHPFPAALDDACASWSSLLDVVNGDGTPPWLAGDSAGGGLALALTQHVVATAQTPPERVALISPWTDLTGSGASVRDNRERDHYLPAHLLGSVAHNYLQGANPADPRASPLFGDMHGLPPVHVHVCETELLRDDGLRVVERIRAAGGEASLHRFGDLPHVFHVFAPLLPEARSALDDVAARLGDANRV